MASDNGSNMVSAWPILRELGAKYGVTIHQDMHARCVCHVINIVVRLFLREIGANQILNVADRSSETCTLQNRKHSHSVNHVRLITGYVYSSPKRLSKFKSQQGMTGDVLLPVTENFTRWNSSFLMLSVH
jgi:hypothetical protein